jgi:hypothetical protein
MKTIPTPSELHPRIAELESKRNALHAEKITMVAEAAMLRARIQESPSNGSAAENRVRAILGEPTIPDVSPDMPRLQELLVKLQAVNTALAILDGEIQKQRLVGQRLVLESVKPEVDGLGRKFATAFLDLHTAHTNYNKIIDSLEDIGVSAIRVLPYGLGWPTDRSGTYHYGTREFVEAGYLKASEIPKAIQ